MFQYLNMYNIYIWKFVFRDNCLTALATIMMLGISVMDGPSETCVRSATSTWVTFRLSTELDITDHVLIVDV